MTLLLVAVPAAPAADDKLPTIKLVLHPAAEPRPALKYHLFPTLADRRPGNAAVSYNAIPLERSPGMFGGRDSVVNKISDWEESPLPEIRQADRRDTIQSLESIVEEIGSAARRDRCDWYLLTRLREHEADNPFAIQLREFQQSRDLGRILAAWVRLAIADGKYDEAVHTLQSGYSLARDVGNAPFLVTALVGTAIGRQMNAQLLTLIQQPGAPNLYWALAWLPRPLVDYRTAFESETYGFEIYYPELNHLESKDYSPEYWRQLLDRFADLLTGVTDTGVAREQKRLLVLAWEIHAYPMARQFLVERGRTEAEVDAMPVAQVIILAAWKNYEELRDDSMKWIGIPYPRSEEAETAAEKRLVASGRSGQEVIPLASLLVPAIHAARIAEVGLGREIALLQTIEALRMYAASHDGSLPEKLSEITEVPPPLDPMHGEPFAYRREGKTGVLEYQGPPGFQGNFEGVRFEITIAGKGD